jgi:hypothetical protein
MRTLSQASNLTLIERPAFAPQLRDLVGPTQGMPPDLNLH